MVVTGNIKLEHGAGGEGMHELLKLVLRYLSSVSYTHLTLPTIYSV